MGKKSKRKSVINGIKYIWSIKYKDADKFDNSFVHIGIWCEELKGQKLNVKVRFDDPYRKFANISEPEDRPITPGLIREIVNEAIKNGWHPTEGKGEAFMKWDRKEKSLYQLSMEEYKIY